jgi:hypothetical protein
MIAIEIAPGPVGTYQDSEDGGGRHRSFPTRAFDMHVRRRVPRRALYEATYFAGLRKAVHAEWITLHDNSNFRGFVDFLRTELDRVGPAYADLCRDFFSRAVALELSFFEAAYTT